MFEELDDFAAGHLDEVIAAFVAYAADAMPAGRYLGWLAEADGEPVGTVGLVFHEQPPHPLMRSTRVGYVLNVFVEPACRRRGVATRLVEEAVAHCDTTGCGAVILHASDAGARVYERLGFDRTSEMRRFL